MASGELTATSIEEPLDTTIQILADEHGLRLRRFIGSPGAGVFLFLLWVGWSVGCVLMVRQAFMEPSLSHLLFPVPFWAVWVGLPFLIRYQFKAVEELLIGGQEVVYGKGAPVPKPEQTTPSQEIRRVRTYLDRDFDNSTNEKYGVLIETTDQPIRFAVGSTQEECAWVSELVRSRLNGTLEHSFHALVCQEPLTEDIEVLDFTAQAHPRPVDSRIRCDQADGTTQFTSLPQPWSGTVPLMVSLIIFVGSTAIFYSFIADGIKIRWDHLLSVIIFGMIAFGSACFFGSVLVRPWKTVSYAFTARQIGRRWRVGQFQHDRYFPIDDLNGLELRWTVNYKLSLPAHSTTFFDGRSDLPFSIVFVDRSQKDLLEIRNLTQPEARWMADVLLREYHRKQFSN